jgi:two-component system NarL family sensor kinase
MGRQARGLNPGASLAARLHDTSTGLAISIGLLQGALDDDALVRVRAMLEDSLANLRGLTASLSRSHIGRSRVGLRDSLGREAARFRLDLKFVMTGDDSWLTPQHLALLNLAGREALRNVRRHAGTDTCRLALYLAGCPFEMRVRDWGSGCRPDSLPRRGLGLLSDLAAESGCTLTITSQPGLGTELVLTGPACPVNSARRAAGSDGSAALLAAAWRSEADHPTPTDAEPAPGSGQIRPRASRLDG